MAEIQAEVPEETRATTGVGARHRRPRRGTPFGGVDAAVVRGRQGRPRAVQRGGSRRHRPTCATWASRCSWTSSSSTSPTTVHRATRVLGALGVEYLTLHATGGVDMLKAGVEGLYHGAERAGLDAPISLAVTVLTSDDTAPDHISAESGSGGARRWLRGADLRCVGSADGPGVGATAATGRPGDPPRWCSHPRPGPDGYTSGGDRQWRRPVGHRSSGDRGR